MFTQVDSSNHPMLALDSPKLAADLPLLAPESARVAPHFSRFYLDVSPPPRVSTGLPKVGRDGEEGRLTLLVQVSHLGSELQQGLDLVRLPLLASREERGPGEPRRENRFPQEPILPRAHRFSVLRIDRLPSITIFSRMKNFDVPETLEFRLAINRLGVNRFSFKKPESYRPLVPIHCKYKVSPSQMPGGIIGAKS